MLKVVVEGDLIPSSAFSYRDFFKTSRYTNNRNSWKSGFAMTSGRMPAVSFLV